MKKDFLGSNWECIIEALKNHQGNIVMNFFEQGSQYVEKVENQNFYGTMDTRNNRLNGSTETRNNGKEENFAERIRHSITQLMQEKYGDDPLFNQKCHWQAIYRVLVDKGFCHDSDFDGFDAIIQKVMPNHVNKPYSKSSLKQISQTDFARPFNEWRYDVQTSKTRKPYDRMVAVTQRFLEILEKKGL